MYLLPRILEIGCTEDGWYPDIEVIGRAIGQAGPARWNEERRVALTDVLHAVIQKVVGEAEGRTIDEWVCAIAKMGLDVRSFLNQIEESPEAVIDFYERNSEALMKQKLGNAFWKQDDPGYDEVLTWFKSPKVSQILLDGYGLPQSHSQQGGALKP